MAKFWWSKTSAPVTEVSQETAVSEPAPGTLCAVFSTYTPMEAHIVGGMLEEQGIECVLSNELFANMDRPIANATGGVQVLVRASDADRARELLREAEEAGIG